MRGVVFHKAGEPWTVEDRARPEPGPGEICLRVERCGICGSDLSLTAYEGAGFPPGMAMGHEFAGEIVALGEGVTDFAVGDLVTAMPSAGCGTCRECLTGKEILCRHRVHYMGGMGQYMCVAARIAVRLPEGVTAADGAIVEPLAVGLHAARLAGIGPGARVLVTGAGMIGLATIYWVRRLGAEKIVALSRSARRADLAQQMGADSFVTAGPDEVDEVIAAMGGEPDVVFECIGVPGSVGQAMAHVRPDGTVVSLGFCMKPEPLVSGQATLKQIHLLFSFAYTFEEFRMVVDSFAAGHVEPRALVSRVIGIDEVPQVVEAMRGGLAETKVQIDPWAN